MATNYLDCEQAPNLSIPAIRLSLCQKRNLAQFIWRTNMRRWSSKSLFVRKWIWIWREYQQILYQNRSWAAQHCEKSESKHPEYETTTFFRILYWTQLSLLSGFIFAFEFTQLCLKFCRCFWHGCQNQNQKWTKRFLSTSRYFSWFTKAISPAWKKSLQRKENFRFHHKLSILLLLILTVSFS